MAIILIAITVIIAIAIIIATVKMIVMRVLVQAIP